MEKQKKEETGVTKTRSVLANMAARYAVEPAKLMETLKQTAFKNATNEQLMALCIVADQYKLNPFTKEIYAFPDKNGGIIPVVSIDGWFRIINENPAYDGMEVECDDSECTVKIHRKDRAHPTTLTEYMEEVKRSGNGPWSTHPRRMLRHKAIIQCARAAFGYGGIKDPDEAERIIEAERKPVAMPVAIEAEVVDVPPVVEGAV
jgi:phage recombination protein Bet